MSRRDFVRASYTGSATKGQSAARLARYMEERKQEREPEKELEDSREHEPGREQHEAKQRESEQGDEQREPERYEKATTFGEREGFKEAAKDRADAGRRSSYVHVVVSPERGNELTDRDFERLVEPWTRDRQGRDCEYLAAVHRDTEHAHVHIAVARDKFHKAEYAELKEATRERIEDRERFHGEPEKDLAQEQEERALRMEKTLKHSMERTERDQRLDDREREPAAGSQDRQSEREPARDRSEEMER